MGGGWIGRRVAGSVLFGTTGIVAIVLPTLPMSHSLGVALPLAACVCALPNAARHGVCCEHA